ncbi:hypothetical protein HDU84_005119 [Entophlyctis sp. JEL0112]|nr:hypothetical protein HDU84_005119 [Entophlyctis sp. JEL0112]
MEYLRLLTPAASSSFFGGAPPAQAHVDGTPVAAALSRILGGVRGMALVPARGLAAQFFALDVASQAVVCVLLLLAMRFTVGAFRSALRTLWWAVKLSVVILAAAIAVKAVYV